MDNKAWKILDIQFVIAFGDLNEDIKNIPKKLSDSFSGEAMILPIPEDAPKEIPRLIIPSEDGFKIEISDERISIFFQNFEDDMKEIDACKNDLIEKIDAINKKLSINISWIGLILRTINENDSANDNIKKVVTAEGQKVFDLSDGDKDILIRYHDFHNIKIKDIDYRGHLNVEFGSNIRDVRTGGEQVGNSFMLDINTRESDKKVTYEAETLLKFIDVSFSTQAKYFKELNTLVDGK